MTNPACKTCDGWGFKNKARAVGGFGRVSTEIAFDPPVMEFCDDVYPSHDRIPPELRGQPCTPRTEFRRYSQPDGFTRVQHDDRMRGGMRLRSEKAAETRAINKAKRAQEAAPTTKGKR